MKHIGCVFIVLCLLLAINCVYCGFSFYEEGVSISSTGTVGRLVKKDERIPIVSTEFGEISAVDIADGIGSGSHSYHLQFITLEPNSLFLPVLLHADMVFYVQTGSGKLSWTDGDELYKVELKRGDTYRLRSGTLFYLHSSLEAERPRLRISAIFANLEEDQLQGPSIGPYSSINDLVRGFDKRILQAAFQVSEEAIEELTSATDTPAIVHAESKKKNFWQEELQFIKAFIGIQRYNKQIMENKKKHTKTFNFFTEDPDFENCNGWSTVVTKHNFNGLEGSQLSVFMVNLTKGSMMGPHWNPMATEVSIVLEGEGMVRVVCPSALMNRECKNSRFRVDEGDVFTVPRFTPMAQTSFNNGSLVFMGFSTTSKKNHPQFIAGKASVLHTLSKNILSTSFNVSNTTIDQLLSAQEKAIILDCTSCAEEQEMLMEGEIEKERQEEERKQEEEARRREEEERRRREEEARRREEEERKRQEEEQERKRQEEEERRKQEEEEERRRQEEQRRQEEEEEERRRREEEERKRQEEIERQREEEERRKQEEIERQRKEEQRRQEEEERRRQAEKEREQRRQEEIERQREEEERRRQEEEEIERQREEEEEEWRIQEEEERRRQAEEEREQRRQEEEERDQREEEERRRQEEEEIERQREEEEEEEEEERRRHEEEERRREAEEEREQRRQEEIERQEEEERRWEEEKGSGEQESEQEIAEREEEERIEWQRRAEEEARKRREQGDGIDSL